MTHLLDAPIVTEEMLAVASVRFFKELNEGDLFIDAHSLQVAVGLPAAKKLSDTETFTSGGIRKHGPIPAFHRVIAFLELPKRVN